MDEGSACFRVDTNSFSGRLSRQARFFYVCKPVFHVRKGREVRGMAYDPKVLPFVARNRLTAATRLYVIKGFVLE